MPAANQGSGHRALSGRLSPVRLRDVTNCTGECGHRALSTRLSPTCVIQCHSPKLLHPVIHDSRPYLVSVSSRYFAAKPSRDTKKNSSTRGSLCDKVVYSAAVKQKVNYYTQTWPLSAYNDHYVCLFLFPVYKPFTRLIVCYVSTSSLTQPTYICLLSLSCS